MNTEEHTNNNQILTTIEDIEQTTKDHIDSNKYIILEMIQHNKVVLKIHRKFLIWMMKFHFNFYEKY